MYIWPAAEDDFFADNRHPSTFDSAYYFVFDKNEIFQNFDDAGQWQPFDELKGDLKKNSVRHYMGDLSGIACFAVESHYDDLKPENYNSSNLRSLIGKTNHTIFSLAGRAAQILDWYRSHQYCGKCGLKTVDHPEDRAMVCETCSIHSYPRLSPSIITLIHDNDRVLLARNHRFPKDMYSTLAGFVEPGESIEETVHREVFEEVGVKIKNLEYLGSQPWPFPNSLMLGFLAEYDSGDIVLQEEEIEDAQWFSCDDLPMIPGKVAISRWIIDTYLDRLGHKI